MLSLRYPAEVNLHGDAADTLKALLPLIRRKEDRDWSKTIEANVAAWWKKLEGRAKADAKPVNPQRVVWEMSPLAAGKRHRHQRQRILRQLVCPRLPRAAGPVRVALRRPGLHGRGGALRHRRQVRASRSAGDRARRRRRHADEQHGRTDHRPEILEALGGSALDRMRVQQPGSQRSHLGTACHGGQSEIRRLPGHSGLRYAKFGEMLGFKGIFVDFPDRLASAWQEALSSDRPVVLEVKTDPDVAPLPPHVTLKQARGFISSITKGDAAGGHIIGENGQTGLGRSVW